MVDAKKIDELFRLWQDNPGAGGQLVINYKGEVFERCYGYQNIETQTPMTQDSIFHLASMSKQVTAMCVYMLFEQGKLDLNDDIKKYVGDIIHVPQTVTINNLLHHTSGLPDHYSFLFLTGRSAKDTVTQAEILRLYGCIRELDFEPGEKYSYSNPNYVLLAAIVERITGQTLNQFARENIFKPLGMANTFVREDPEMLIPNRVHSYTDNGYTYKNSTLNLTMYGSTTLHSTARDMNVFLRQYMNPTCISRETMQNFMLMNPPLNDGTPSDYAGGVHIEQLEGHRCVSHSGVNAGFRNFGICFPEDDLVITLLSNTHNLLPKIVAKDVARVVLGLPARVPKNLDAYKTETVDLGTVAGVYYCDASGDNYTISVRDGVVCRGGVKLQPVGGNLFKQGRLDVTFAFGENPAVLQENTILPLRKLTAEITEKQAAEYVGRYFCEDFESFWQIRWEKEKLWLFHTHHGMQQLRWLDGDRFFNGTTQYTFLRNAQGQVTGINRSVARARKMILTKL